jgi:hypothetical protein
MQSCARYFQCPRPGSFSGKQTCSDASGVNNIFTIPARRSKVAAWQHIDSFLSAKRRRGARPCFSILLCSQYRATLGGARSYLKDLLNGSVIFSKRQQGDAPVFYPLSRSKRS